MPLSFVGCWPRLAPRALSTARTPAISATGTATNPSTDERGEGRARPGKREIQTPSSRETGLGEASLSALEVSRTRFEWHWVNRATRLDRKRIQSELQMIATKR